MESQSRSNETTKRGKSNRRTRRIKFVIDNQPSSQRRGNNTFFSREHTSTHCQPYFLNFHNGFSIWRDHFFISFSCFFN
jgi:hypothetical protein